MTNIELRPVYLETHFPNANIKENIKVTITNEHGCFVMIMKHFGWWKEDEKDIGPS